MLLSFASFCWRRLSSGHCFPACRGWNGCVLRNLWLHTQNSRFSYYYAEGEGLQSVLPPVLSSMDIIDTILNIFKLAKYSFLRDKFLLPCLTKGANNETIAFLETHMPLTHSLLIGLMCFSLFVFPYNELSCLWPSILKPCWGRTVLREESTLHTRPLSPFDFT